MTLREPPSVTVLERDGELVRLGEMLDAAAGGDGAMLSILGPAGIGKSSLLAEVRRMAAGRGFRSLGAAGSRLERGFPFGVCRQLLDPVVREASRTDRDGLFDGASAIGAHLVRSPPDPVGRAGHSGVPYRYDYGGADDFRSLHGLYWLTANLADSSPVLITVDDAHWADWNSVRFLDFLARRLDGLPIAAVVTGREAEPDAPGELFGSVLVEPAVHALRPAPLSEDATAALIEGRFEVRPADGFAAACCQAAGGNPFYLAELLSSLQEAGVDPALEDGARVSDVAPPAISRSVLERVRRLGNPAVTLVRAVAVLGGRADLSMVADLAGMADSETVATADALVRANILTVERTVRFVHPIMQTVVHDDTPTFELARAHRRAADLLVAQSAGPLDIATHLLRSRPAHDGEVRRRLHEAANTALADGATQTAVEFLRRALSESPPPAEQFELTATLGRTLAAQGSPEGVDLMRAAVRTALDPLERAQVAVPLASALCYLGLDGEAVAALEDALTALPRGHGSALRDQIEAMLMVIGITDQDGRRNLEERIARTLSEFRRAPASIPPSVLSPLAIELIFHGRRADEAADVARQALAGGGLVIGEDMGSPLVYVAAYALIATGRASYAERELDAAEKRAMQEGSGGAMAVISAARSMARLRQGDLRGAQADAEQCLGLCAGQSPKIFTPIALATLATAQLECGELADARALLSDPTAHRVRGDGVLTQPLLESRVRLSLATGEYEDAMSQLEACRAWADTWGEASGSWPVQWRSMMARAVQGAGDASRARDIAREDVALARRFGARRPIGRALVALGLAAGGEQGIAHLRKAVDVLAGSEDRLEHAHALVELGAARRRQGARAAARPALASGMSMARECGATALAERAYEELRATGARPPRIVATGVEALTPSELRVARLAAAGSTNKQIAQSLFVTQKTVEVHLSHAFQKLGICRRTELPAVLGGGSPAALSSSPTRSGTHAVPGRMPAGRR